ncbi:MAG: hypothetical protein LBS89_03525 [Zoogloeaceae bacterium]|jgi:hypothetical protein|nr:hypothetical protein [Zoogloeaceae bacterium]
MDIENTRLLLQVLNMVGTVVIGCWMYLEKRNDKTNVRIDALTGRVEQADRALMEIKGAAQGQLRLDDLTKVYDRINGIDRKLSEMTGEFRGVSDTLKLLVNKITEKGLQ